MTLLVPGSEKCQGAVFRGGGRAHSRETRQEDYNSDGVHRLNDTMSCFSPRRWICCCIFPSSSSSPSNSTGLSQSLADMVHTSASGERRCSASSSTDPERKEGGTAAVHVRQRRRSFEECRRGHRKGGAPKAYACCCYKTRGLGRRSWGTSQSSGSQRGCHGGAHIRGTRARDEDAQEGGGQGCSSSFSLWQPRGRQYRLGRSSEWPQAVRSVPLGCD